MVGPKVWTKDYSILISANMFYSFGFYMLMPTIPLCIVALGGTEAQVGLVATAFSAASIFIRFFVNVVLRKADKKKTFLTGMILTVLIIAMYNLAETVGSICVIRILQGFGFGIVTTLCSASVADILPNSRKGEGIGYFGMGTVLAAAICPALGLYVLSGYGFNAMFLVAAVFPLIAFVEGMFFTPPRRANNPDRAAAAPQVEVADDPAKSKWQFVLNRIYDPRLSIQALLLVLLGISRSADMNFISLFAAQQNIAFLAWYYIVQTAASFALRGVIGKIMDRKGNSWSILPGACALLASLLLLSFTHSTAMLLIAGLCSGLGFGAVLPTMQAWLFRSVETRKSRLASATYFNFYEIGIAIGAVFFGFLVGFAGYTWMFRTAALFVIFYLLIYIRYINRKRGQVEKSS